MADIRIALGVAACLLELATGCSRSTTLAGQVQETELGTYSIRIAGTTGIAQGNKAMNDAIDKAGQYCHSKGHKLVVVPNPSQSLITFRCGDPI
jgi:hypothetical protein